MADLVETLLKGNGGEEGEMHLGYKRKESVVTHLNEILQKKLAESQQEDLVIAESELFFLIQVHKLEKEIQQLETRMKPMSANAN